ncbi:MAG: DUF3489 domain-containing protein [Pseudomonadota bacterium]
MDVKVETNVEHKRHLSVGNRGGFEGGRGSSLSAISSVPVEIETGRTGTVRLSEAQQVVLAHASANEDARLIWPLDDRPLGAAVPDNGFGSTPNDRDCIKALYRKGMLDGDLFSLKLTAKAFVALQIDPVEWPERLRWDVSAADAVTGVGVTVEESDPRGEEPAVDSGNFNAPMTVSPSLTQNMRAGSKGAALIDLLARDGGATLDELQQASGWQAHSVRGFLSGTVRKKWGGQLELDKNAHGQTTWRLVDTVELPEVVPPAPIIGVDKAQ